MTNFLNNIFDKRDKPISESSRKLYIRNLEKMNDNKEVTNVKFLQDTSRIISGISKYKPTTQRSFIISICTVLKNNDDKLYQFYFELLSKMNNDLKVNVEKTDKQKANWIDQSEINIIFNELKKKATSNKNKNKEGFDKVLNYLILSLYTLNMAPRRNIDYTLMKVSSDMTDTNFNYIDLQKKTFIFNNYKTQGKYNEVAVEINDDLLQVVYLYLKFHPDSKKLKNKKYDFHFLVNSNGDPIDKSQSMTTILNKIFNKKIGSSMLRNMYLTNKYGAMMQEMKQDVKTMSTSVDVAMNNYIKQD